MNSGRMRNESKGLSNYKVRFSSGRQYRSSLFALRDMVEISFYIAPKLVWAG